MEGGKGMKCNLGKKIDRSSNYEQNVISTIWGGGVINQGLKGVESNIGT